MERAAPRGGGGAEQQGFHLHAETDTLRRSSISSLRSSNQMDTLIITPPTSEGANGALSADYGWEQLGWEEEY